MQIFCTIIDAHGQWEWVDLILLNGEPQNILIGDKLSWVSTMLYSKKEYSFLSKVSLHHKGFHKRNQLWHNSPGKGNPSSHDIMLLLLLSRFSRVRLCRTLFSSHILKEPTRLPCPWDSPGKNTGVGCHFLLPGISSTQGLNTGLPHGRWILYHLSH